MSEDNDTITETFIANNTSFEIKSSHGMKKLKYTSESEILIEFNKKPWWSMYMNQNIVSSILGVFLLCGLVFLSIYFPNPSKFQIRVWIAIMSLAGGAFATIIPGLINVKINAGKKLTILASGSIAIFVILYMVVPTT